VSIIRKRTEALELRLSNGYVLPKRLVLKNGFMYIGSLGTAANDGYYTAMSCKNMSKPVTPDEFAHITHYAMFKVCYQDNCLWDNGKNVRPCLPVFYRGRKE